MSPRKSDPLDAAYDRNEREYRRQIDAYHAQQLAGLEDIAQRAKRPPRVPKGEPPHLLEVVILVTGLLVVLLLAACAFGWSVKSLWELWEVLLWR